jgi:hypothetical protein
VFDLSLLLFPVSVKPHLMSSFLSSSPIKDSLPACPVCGLPASLEGDALEWELGFCSADCAQVFDQTFPASGRGRRRAQLQPYLPTLGLNTGTDISPFPLSDSSAREDGQESFISARDDEGADLIGDAPLTEASRLAGAQRRIQSALFSSRAVTAPAADGSSFVAAETSEAVASASFTDFSPYVRRTVSIIPTGGSAQGLVTGTDSLDISVEFSPHIRPSTPTDQPIAPVGAATQRRALGARAAEQRRFSAQMRGRGRGQGALAPHNLDAGAIAPQALFRGKTTQSEFTAYNSAPVSALAVTDDTQGAQGGQHHRGVERTVLSVPPPMPSTGGAPSSPAPSQASTHLQGIDFFRMGSDLAVEAGLEYSHYSQLFIQSLRDVAQARESSIVIFNGNMPRIVRIEDITEDDDGVKMVCSQPQIRTSTSWVQGVADLYVLPTAQLGQPATSVTHAAPLASFFRLAAQMCSRTWIQSFRAQGDTPVTGAAGQQNPLHAHASPAVTQVSDEGGADFGQDRGVIFYPPRPDHVRPLEFAKTEIFRKWQPDKERPYKGECRLGSDLSDYTALPHLWLDHMQSRFNFFGIDIRYWVHGALFCVVKEIRERYQQHCQASDSLLRIDWVNLARRLFYAETDLEGRLPMDDPMSWMVFSAWLKMEFTSPNLVKRQIDFLTSFRQLAGQSTREFNTNYRVQMQRTKDLSEVYPASAQEDFDGIVWRKRYLDSLLPAVRSVVEKFLAEDAVRLHTGLRSDSSLDYMAMARQVRAIDAGFDGKRLADIMVYAETMDARCYLSRGQDFRQDRVSLAASQPRSFRSSSMSSSNLRARVNHLAIEDDPARAAPSNFDDGGAQSQGPLVSDATEDTVEAFFGRLATQHRVIWSRDQIMKLRQNNLCFHCARPNCMARTCKNPRADPAKTALNNIEVSGTCHFLPDDVDLYDNLVEYGHSLNGVASEEH